MHQRLDPSPKTEEIDLVELVQNLWAEKLLIGLIVIVATLAALGYAYSVTPLYASRVVIAPAPLNNFGALAGALSARQTDEANMGISHGVRLANETFAVFVNNLESQLVQREFKAANAAYSQVAVEIKRGRAATEPVTINATGPSAEQAKAFLDAYMNHTVTTTATQLTEYLKGMQINQAVEAASLYRLEQPAEVVAKPVKPKRMLIVALGLVLGGMLGVFIALIRIMLKKRTVST